MNTTTAKTASELAEQEAIVNTWLANAPEETVIRFGEYSPNGSPSTWQEHTPAEQSAPELTDEEGEPIWDTVTLSADGMTLELASTPERSKHVYHTYTHAEPEPGELLAAFRGDYDAVTWDTIEGFRAFLTGTMSLRRHGRTFRECMKAALLEAADQLDD